MTINHNYASLNRRLTAALVDLMFVLVTIAPLTSFIVNFVSDGRDPFVLISAYMETHKESTIDVNDALGYLKEHNAIVPYILSQIISIVLTMIYCVSFWRWQGATLGKILLRLKVVDASTGGLISLRQGVLRAIGYVPSSLFFIIINFRKDHRGLHDLMANTVVIVQNLQAKQ